MRGILLAGMMLLLAAGCDSGEPSEAEIIGDHGFGAGQFSKPRALAVAPDGCFFVVDMQARIQRFGPDGEFEVSWQMPKWESGKPTGIDIHPDGRVFVADTHYYRVMVFDRDGRKLDEFGSYGEGPGEFFLTTGVAFGPDGDLFVSEYGGNDRISRFSATYDYKYSFGGPDAGIAQLARPQSMVFDGEGTLWVADAVNHRVCQFNVSGELLSTIGTMGSGPGQLKYPYDLDVCDDGSLVVCEYGNNRLQWFDRDGNSLRTWGQAGHRPGELAEPWGVEMGLDGRVYIVDALNHRIQLIRM